MSASDTFQGRRRASSNLLVNVFYRLSQRLLDRDATGHDMAQRISGDASDARIPVREGADGILGSVARSYRARCQGNGG